MYNCKSVEFYFRRSQRVSCDGRSSILRTVLEAETETLILPLAFDLTEKAQTRILPLVMENCPDYRSSIVSENRESQFLRSTEFLKPCIG
ncbi:hypothetical protein QUA27_01390 [Microcoleus sp. Pol14C6]|uniref:hypothetical protein n=1 Tax=unclassified Microcoleus TaxID=2642155 RepID=UPI002FD0B1D2